MNKNNSVFITGATGFLGSYLLKILLESGKRVYALSRRKKNILSKERVLEMLKFWEFNINEDRFRNNLKIVDGDISMLNLGLSSGDQQTLIREVNTIFHSAALAELRLPIEIARKVNVGGTKNVLDFALRCKNLQKVSHISTAYVIGSKSDIDFNEDKLDVGQKFNNTYEQSKFEAEILVHKYKKLGLKILIFRPSLIMGDSKTGKTSNFKIFYQPLHFFANNVFCSYPSNASCSHNLINVDTVASAISILSDTQEKGCYHLISPKSISMNSLIKSASEYFNFKMPKIVPFDKYDIDVLTPTQKALILPFYPYFNYTATIIANKTSNILLDHGFKTLAIDKNNLSRIFRYCVSSGFIRM